MHQFCTILVVDMDPFVLPNVVFDHMVAIISLKDQIYILILMPLHPYIGWYYTISFNEMDPPNVVFDLMVAISQNEICLCTHLMLDSQYHLNSTVPGDIHVHK